MAKVWFKRKKYGWGWTPASLEGWISVLLAVFLAVFVGINTENIVNGRQWFFEFIIPLVAIVEFMLLVGYAKGERPAWKWGGE